MSNTSNTKTEEEINYENYLAEEKRLRAIAESLPGVPRSILIDIQRIHLHAKIIRTLGEVAIESDSFLQKAIISRRLIECGADVENVIKETQIAKMVSDASVYFMEKSANILKLTLAMIESEEFLAYFEAYENACIDEAIESYILLGTENSRSVFDARSDIF